MTLILTPELVANAHRHVADPGPSSGTVYLQDEDYAWWVDHILSGRRQGEQFWVFAYGSLIWKPEFEAAEERIAHAHGWHRAFALKLTRWRGSPEHPGLMLALDRGGACKGIAYRLAEEELAETLGKLLRREMSVKPPSNVPRWIGIQILEGQVRALAFAVDRKAPAYASGLPLEQVVEVLSTAVGHWGSCAEYLYNTVTHLEARGIRDRKLWLLQALVAERLRTAIRA